MSVGGVVFVAVLAAGAGGDGSSSADEIAAAILNSAGPAEADERLRGLSPRIEGRVEALGPLLRHIVAGSGTDQHWTALCKVDAWSDGAWFIEMRGAAYDALRAAPSHFVGPYLAGNDCALLMILYGLDWPRTSLGPIHECGADLPTALHEFDDQMSSFRQTLLSGVDGHSEQPRERILFETVQAFNLAWIQARDQHRAWCERQK